MTARTADFFDRYARDFDAIYGNRNTPMNRVVNVLFRRSMRMRYLLTLEGCEPVAERSVLDVGCGPGHYSVALARRGAARVVGVDFAEGMLDISRASAANAGVEGRCSFIRADFLSNPPADRFDYTIVMGFMDYMSDPDATVSKIMTLTTRRAFFSFPLDGGLLAWQRKVRYRSRCDLFLYSPGEVDAIFKRLGVRADVRKIDRDLFVTAHVD